MCAGLVNHRLGEDLLDPVAGEFGGESAPQGAFAVAAGHGEQMPDRHGLQFGRDVVGPLVLRKEADDRIINSYKSVRDRQPDGRGGKALA